jgi:hypothetical protein
MNKTYPAVLFVATHGRTIAIGVASMVAVAATALLALGSETALAVTGYLAAIAIWAVLRLAAEIVEVVAETLLPR